MLRTCLSDPIPEIFSVAKLLNDAVSAHLLGNKQEADSLIRLANSPIVREWTESLWGIGGPASRPVAVGNPLPFVTKENRITVRMPRGPEKRALVARDGYHCRFCGIPLIRAETRRAIQGLYPQALTWGRRNPDQHAAFQAMWLQYDHLLPHAWGGTNDMENIVVTCAPCNFGRMNLTLDQVGLLDPRMREPVRSDWDGLERINLPRSS